MRFDDSLATSFTTELCPPNRNWPDAGHPAPNLTSSNPYHGAGKEPGARGPLATRPTKISRSSQK
jgi:hypothetical protein